MFKVGDYICGTNRCDGIYSITNSRMYFGVVLEVNNDYIHVKIILHDGIHYIGQVHAVEEKYFDKIEWR